VYERQSAYTFVRYCSKIVRAQIALVAARAAAVRKTAPETPTRLFTSSVSQSHPRSPG